MQDTEDEFTFKTFCDWVRNELEEGLRRRWKSKRAELVCQRHRQRPRADRSQPTACPLGGEQQLSADTVEMRSTSSVRNNELDLP